MNIFNFYGPIYGDIYGFTGAEDEEIETIANGIPAGEPAPTREPIPDPTPVPAPTPVVKPEPAPVVKPEPVTPPKPTYEPVIETVEPVIEKVEPVIEEVEPIIEEVKPVTKPLPVTKPVDGYLDNSLANVGDACGFDMKAGKYTPCATGLICLNRLCASRAVLNFGPPVEDEDDGIEVVEVIEVKTDDSTEAAEVKSNDSTEAAEVVINDSGNDDSFGGNQDDYTETETGPLSSVLDAEIEDYPVDAGDEEPEREVFHWGFDPYVKTEENRDHWKEVGIVGETIPAATEVD